MAKCPKCEREWLWDWCADSLRLADGPLCGEEETQSTGVWQLICPCGTTLAETDEDGNVDFLPDAWKGIDWEAPQHCYESYCYQETNQRRELR